MKLLQRGGFGEAWECDVKDVGKCVAKVLRDTRNQKAVGEFEKECRLLKSMPPHENVVRFVTEQRNLQGALLAIFMQHCGSRTLLEIYQAKSVPASDAFFYSDDIRRGLCHLHALGIAHRDLKLENCAVDDATKVVRLLDFGLSTSGDDRSWLKQVGTAYYMAPEVRYGTTPYEARRTDAWSFGICLFMMHTGGYMPSIEYTETSDNVCEWQASRGGDSFGTTEFLIRESERKYPTYPLSIPCPKRRNPNQHHQE